MQKTIRKSKIIGSRCFSNYFWTFFLSIGGISFFISWFIKLYKNQSITFY